MTGAASGIGRALVDLLEREGARVLGLDLRDGFDVADPAAWDAVGPVELACLNAGVVTGEADVASLGDADYRRVLGVNVDGVVFGVRRLARALEPGSAIVATASLAGLVGVEQDPIYALSKHAVVGFVRSVAPQLERRGIRINAVAPGFVDTPMVSGAERERFAAAGFPLLRPEDVAEAALQAARSAGSGEVWFVQPGRDPEPFRFRGVPGPRTPGAEGAVPPL